MKLWDTAKNPNASFNRVKDTIDKTGKNIKLREVKVMQLILRNRQLLDM